MLDISFIRSNPDAVREGLRAKGSDPALVDSFLLLDTEWRTMVADVDRLRTEQKVLSASRAITEAKAMKERVHDVEARLRIIEEARDARLRTFPNLPFSDVPRGNSSADNVVLREVGAKPQFSFSPRDYLSLAESLDLIDLERAAKVSGSRFGYLKNATVLLEFALTQFALRRLIQEGFTPLIPPVMIKADMMRGMGYVDRGSDEEESYFFEKDDMYLVGTSEQSVGPMYADEIVQERELPKRFVAFSTCFRREAGSYGKDTKGILRVHQFDKLEMFSLTTPTQSQQEHAFFLSLQEEFMQQLGLPYRVVQLCTGDLSHPAAASYDIEAWMPGQNEGKGEYRETHSASNTTDFQARRLRVRYKSASGETIPVHMVNGTAFSMNRPLIAIFENYQTKEGTIRIPDVLQEWVGMKEIKK